MNIPVSMNHRARSTLKRCATVLDLHTQNEEKNMDKENCERSNPSHEHLRDTVHFSFFCEKLWFFKIWFLGGIGSNFQEWFVIPLSMLEMRRSFWLSTSTAASSRNACLSYFTSAHHRLSTDALPYLPVTLATTLQTRCLLHSIICRRSNIATLESDPPDSKLREGEKKHRAETKSNQIKTQWCTSKAVWGGKSFLQSGLYSSRNYPYTCAVKSQISVWYLFSYLWKSTKLIKYESFFCLEALEFQCHFALRPSKAWKLVHMTSFKSKVRKWVPDKNVWLYSNPFLCQCVWPAREY